MTRTEELPFDIRKKCLSNFERINSFQRKFRMDQKEPTNVSRQSTGLESPSNGVYHIYHTGKGGESYSIHTVSDSNAALKLEPNAAGPQNHEAKDPSPAPEPVLRRQSTLSKMSTRMKRSKAYDDPRYDPRTESSPYFIHLPKLAFHLPPCTLRQYAFSFLLITSCF